MDLVINQTVTVVEEIEHPTSLVITQTPKPSVIEMGVAGPQGPPGRDASGGGGILIVAVEDLPAFAVVTIGGHRADSGNTAHIRRVAGIISAAIANGFSGEAVALGEITNPAWNWTPGSILFLNGQTLSTLPPSTGFSQAIAVAKTSDTLFIDLSDPVLL